MRETPEEIADIQRMFDAHMARANPHMKAIVTRKRRLTAEQVVRHLEGTRIVALATVTPSGKPRVSPLDSLFLHGRFTLSTDVRATRVAHLRANAACSAVYMEADRIAVVANGTVEWITREHIDHDEIHAAWQATYDSDPYTWGDVIFFRIAPISMWAYAFHPEEFPGG
jgi:uncharacterized pyridoxamine 5'-phosphate oxidase family protein